MKTLFLTLPAVLVLACATFVQSAKKTVFAGDNLADATMRGWAQYFKEATNNPAQFHETLAQVEEQHQAVNGTAKEVGVVLSTAHTMLTAYDNGLATKSQVQAAIDAVAQATPKLVQMVVAFTGKTNLLSGQPLTK